MAAPNSRQTLIEYSLRQLGAPVVDINVDWQQCEDRLDDALQQFSERHFDGVEKAFFLYPVTAEDIVLSPNKEPSFIPCLSLARLVSSITSFLKLL